MHTPRLLARPHSAASQPAVTWPCLASGLIASTARVAYKSIAIICLHGPQRELNGRGATSKTVAPAEHCQKLSNCQFSATAPKFSVSLLLVFVIVLRRTHICSATETARCAVSVPAPRRNSQPPSHLFPTPHQPSAIDSFLLIILLRTAAFLGPCSHFFLLRVCAFLASDLRSDRLDRCGRRPSRPESDRSIFAPPAHRHATRPTRRGQTTPVGRLRQTAICRSRIFCSPGTDDT